MSKLQWFLVGVVVLGGLSAPALWNLLSSDRSGPPDWPIVAATLFDTPDQSWGIATSEGWAQGNPDVLNYKSQIVDGALRFLFDVSEGRPGGTFWSRSDEFVVVKPHSSYFEVDVQVDGSRSVDDPRYGFFVEAPDGTRVWQFYLTGGTSWEVWGPGDFVPVIPDDPEQSNVDVGINQMSILMGGRTVKFAINDSTVYETTSVIPVDSRIRLFMGASQPSRSLFQVSFDNAVLKVKN